MATMLRSILSCYFQKIEVADGYIIGGCAFAGDGAVEGAGYHLGYNNQGSNC